MGEKSEIHMPNDDIGNAAFTVLLVDMITLRNAETKEHIWYVRQYSKIISRAYAKYYPRSRMSSNKQELIVEAAGIHDVGKLMMQDCLLYKQGRMSPYELELYKKERRNDINAYQNS